MKKTYIFNKHQVCEKPDIAVLIPYKEKSMSGTCILEIRTAMYKGKWVSGYHYNGHNCGGASPCSPGLGKEVFDTEKQAISYQLQKLKDILAHRDKKNETQIILKFIEDYLKPKIEQLSLFL